MYGSPERRPLSVRLAVFFILADASPLTFSSVSGKVNIILKLGFQRTKTCNKFFYIKD